jgi:hypothetical protein
MNYPPLPVMIVPLLVEQPSKIEGGISGVVWFVIPSFIPAALDVVSVAIEELCIWNELAR